MAEDDDLLKRNEQLNRRIRKYGADDSIAALAQSMRHVRRQALLMAVSLGLDLLLSIVTLFLYIKLDHVVHTADVNSNNLYLNCISSNQARATELQIWTFVLDAPADPTAPPQTQAQKDLIKQFKNLLNTNLAQRDCSKVVSP